MSGADLAGRDLRGICPSDGNLEKVILRDANLEGANIDRANMFGASLVEADLSDACCDRACFAGTGVNQMFVKGASMCGAFFRNLKGHPAGVREENSSIMENCSARRQVWTEC